MARVCVDGISFDAAHYTPVDGVPLLHGHTFSVSVCVDGEVGSDSMVIDFIKLREVVEGVVRQYRYSLLIPEKDASNVIIKGPFKVKLVVINCEFPTAEVLALRICEELATVLKQLTNVSSISVGVREGGHNYAEVTCGGF